MTSTRLRRFSFMAMAILSIVGCGGGGSSSTTPDTTPPSTALNTTTPTSTHVDPDIKAAFDQLNADRLRCGFGAVEQNAKLDLAAQNHATYVALNHDVSHYETQGSPGFTGADPWKRFTNVGYNYITGSTETVVPDYYGASVPSAHNLPAGTTQPTATHSMRILYTSVYHLVGLMSGNRDVGFGKSTYPEGLGLQDSNIQTVVIDIGTQAGLAQQQIAKDALVSFPCEGTRKLNPLFWGESPNPFPNLLGNRKYMGTPIFLNSAPNTTLNVTSATVTGPTGDVPFVTLNVNNDPQSGVNGVELKSNMWFLVPRAPLADNSHYTVAYTGTNTGMITPNNPAGAFSKTFTFSTGTYNTP